MLLAVGSVKGSPGATTVALALAARWPADVVLVEADPAGGDLCARCGVADHPGLSGLVVAARRGTPHLAEHVQHLGAGVDVVVAPAGASRAAATVAALSPMVVRAAGVDVVADVGRLSDDSPAAGLVADADRVLVVCRGDLASVDHTAAYTRAAAGDGRLGVVVVGDSGYHRSELTELFGVPVLIQVRVDHRGVDVLLGVRAPRRGWHRVGLAAAARAVALELRPRPSVDGLEPVTHTPPTTRTAGSRTATETAS